MRDALLFQLKIKVRVSEAALRPVFFYDDVIGTWQKIWVPLPAPRSLFERMALLNAPLRRIWMIPILVIARSPSPMRHVQYLHAHAARGGDNRAHMVQQANVFGNLFDHWKNLAAVRKKVVVRIDQQQSCALSAIRKIGHSFL